METAEKALWKLNSLRTS